MTLYAGIYLSCEGTPIGAHKIQCNPTFLVAQEVS